MEGSGLSGDYSANYAVNDHFTKKSKTLLPSTMPIVILIAWIVVGGIVGDSLAKLRGNREGLVIGAILGPLGWLAILSRSDTRQRCPACLGVVPDGAKKCMHCAETLPLPPFAIVQCPSCHMEYSVPESFLGQKFKCDRCGK